MEEGFGDRQPGNRHIGPIRVSTDNWKLHRQKHEEIAEVLLKRADARLETQQLLVLVDLQGMYLSLHRWLSGNKFPI